MRRLAAILLLTALATGCATVHKLTHPRILDGKPMAVKVAFVAAHA
jgi:uncharacterized protein YceK